MATKTESAIRHLLDWTSRYGKELCPTAGSADSFGEGIRAAKMRVRAILNDADPEEITRLTAQRDALLEACKAARDKPASIALPLLDAAIKKAEEG